jgi:AraC-like DNA-binding protein
LLLHDEKNAENILITFTEKGASAFFKEPVNELFEHFNSLDAFFKASEIDFFEDQISSAKNNPQRIRIVEQFLMSKLITHKQDDLVYKAIREIYFHYGIVNIHSLSGKFAISQDTFEKRFRKTVGATPKQFASIVRMKSVVALGKQNKSFTELGYNFDFYDQSHFIKEFKSFTGNFSNRLTIGKSMIFYNSKSKTLSKIAT